LSGRLLVSEMEIPMIYTGVNRVKK
jgi:hypothetical protein